MESPTSDELTTGLLTSSPKNLRSEKTNGNESDPGVITFSSDKSTTRFSKHSHDLIPPCDDEELLESENGFWNKYCGRFHFATIQINTKVEQEKLLRSFEAAVLSCDLKLCRELMKTVNKFSTKVNKRIFHLFLFAAQTGAIDILKLMLGDDKGYQSSGDKVTTNYDKDVESSREIINIGLDNIINVTNHQKSSALHLSIRNGHSVSSLYLIRKGIDLTITDIMLNLPIHLAAAKKTMIIVVKALLEKGQDSEIRNEKNMMPIHIAAANGNLDILKVLIRDIQVKETYVEFKGNNNRYPIHFAAVNGHYQCCVELLKFYSAHVNIPDDRGCTPLILAAEKLHYLCCRSLREFDADLTPAELKGNTAMHLAAKGGCIKTIQALIKKKCDEKELFEAKNKSKETPVHLAAAQPHFECLKVLLESLAVNKSECFNWENESKQGLVHLAAKNDCVDSLTYLLDASVTHILNINDKKKQFKVKLHSHDIHGKTALHYACEHSSLKCVKILINNGTNVVSKDKKGNTPIHFAAARGSVELCNILLENVESSAVNKRNTLGETPLHCAVRSNSPDCCAFLAKKGAFIHMKNRKGLSPYHLAVMLGNFEVVKQLTGRGLPIEAFEESEETPLHLVAKQGCTNICRFFLSRMDAKWIYKLNENCNSALDEAFNAGNDEIFSIILSKYNPIWNDKQNKDLSIVEAKEKKLRIKHFELALHYYMDIACNANRPREKIQKAIVESGWWFSGLSACFHKDQKCHNLLHLIKFNPTAAEKVFDRCISMIDGKKVYDFRIFEQSFYKRADITEHSELPFTSPFDLESGKISKDKSLIFDYWNGEIESPLHGVSKYYSQSFDKSSNAAGKGYSGLIRHPLVDGYWNYKWQKYLRNIIWMILLFETIMILVLSLYISHIWNWNQVENTIKNVSTSNCTEEYESDLAKTVKYFPWLLVLRSILAVMAVAVFCSEIYLATMVHWRSLISVGVILRIIRFLGISILIIPFTTCYYHMWIVMTWQWQCGILSLLASWFNMIHVLNLVPAFSVFMPITKKFVKSFFRVLMFITLILFTFAFIFYLLLNVHPAFSNLWDAFIKSIVWMWGDLAYDDLFLSNEYTILYPIMSKIIFIVFVTSIGGFIINLILTQPSDHFESFKNDAACYEASLKIDIILRYDAIVSSVREKHTVAFWIENCEDKEISKFIEMKICGRQECTPD